MGLSFTARGYERAIVNMRAIIHDQLRAPNSAMFTLHMLDKDQLHAVDRFVRSFVYEGRGLQDEGTVSGRLPGTGPQPAPPAGGWYFGRPWGDQA